MGKIQNIVLFGDGACPVGSKLYELAKSVGYLLASRGINIITGGYAGIMDAGLKGASSFDVQRIAVVTKSYGNKVSAFATKTIETENYIKRLDKLIKLGDAFVVFEGGTGTLLELTAIWALAERNLLKKPAYCIGSYWKRIIGRFENESNRFKSAHSVFVFVETLEELNELI